MRTKFEFTLTDDAFVAVLHSQSRRFLQGIPAITAARALTVAISLALMVLLVAILREQSPYKYQLAAGLGFAMFALPCRDWLFQSAHRRALVANSGYSGVARGIEVEAEGLREFGPDCESFTRWSAIETVLDDRDCVLLCVNGLTFCPVPDAAFADRAERDAFVKHVRSQIAAARHRPAQIVSNGTNAVVAMPPARRRTGSGD